MLRGSIARSTLSTSVVLGVRLFVQAGTLVLVARLLGPENYGALAGLTALAVLLGTFSTLGTHLVVLAEVSRDRSREAEVLSYALPVTLVCGALLFIVYFGSSLLLFPNSQILPISIAFFGLAELLLQPLLTICSSQIMARDKASLSQVIMVLPLVLRLASALPIWWLGLPDALLAYSCCYFIASLCALVFALCRLPGKWPVRALWRAPQRVELKNSLGFGVLNATAAAPSELDKTLAIHLIAPSAAGLYSAATRVIGAATLPVLALMFSVMPRLFRSTHSVELSNARLQRHILAVCLFYGTFLGGCFWVFASWLELLFGEHYRGIGEVLRWLVIAIPALVLRMAAGNILMAAGKTWQRAGFESVGILVLVGAAVLLTAMFGPVGMAAALSCAEWAMALVSVYLVIGARKRP